MVVRKSHLCAQAPLHNKSVMAYPDDATTPTDSQQAHSFLDLDHLTPKLLGCSHSFCR
ncbi:hypothetical protein EXN66_Car014992 [Channa argus]|uniref:Uncharacterized protein n=1 Tax=Channa argus TaxID=215402 RepID=A0A6G1Q9T1_CHAAH|nr:hypothetical protein EXN66_Car014992 [Channa argus]